LLLALLPVPGSQARAPQTPASQLLLLLLLLLLQGQPSLVEQGRAAAPDLGWPTSFARLSLLGAWGEHWLSALEAWQQGKSPSQKLR